MSAQYVGRYHVNTDEHLRQITTSLNEVISGRLNVTGTFTMGSGTNTTDLIDPRINEGSVVIIVPLDSNGRGIGWNLGTRAKGSVQLEHDAPGADAEFVYITIG